MSKDELWNEFRKFMVHINKNKQEDTIESFSNMNTTNNSYVDLVIIVLFGIILIFIIFHGRKMKFLPLH